MFAPVMKAEGEIWAISSGKGGTGKSFITSCLGTSLALRGNRVVLVDADFGAPNLHSFLGVNRPRKSLTDFFEKKVSLSDLIVETGIGDLGLITGDIGSLDSDNIKYTQRLKFFRHIKSIKTDYILIDLSAGSSYKTIDTLLLADKMIAILFPQLIAIENIYHFVKNVIFRKLIRSLSAHGYRDVVQQTWKVRGDYGIKNIRELIDQLSGMQTQVGEIVRREISSFRIHLILNQMRSKNEAIIGHYVKSILKKYFGLNTEYLGFVEYHDSAWRCVNEKKAFMATCSLSRCARQIERITENLTDETQAVFLRG